MDKVSLVVGVIGAVLIAVLVWATVVAAKEERAQWMEFKVAHNCRVVERTKSDTMTSPVFSTNGQVSFATTTIPAKTAWLCDDGVTYWRDRSAAEEATP